MHTNHGMHPYPYPHLFHPLQSHALQLLVSQLPLLGFLQRDLLVYVLVAVELLSCGHLGRQTTEKTRGNIMHTSPQKEKRIWKKRRVSKKVTGARLVIVPYHRVMELELQGTAIQWLYVS